MDEQTTQMIQQVIREEIRSAISQIIEPMLLRGGTIKKLRLEPGEIFCLFSPETLTAAVRQEILFAMNNFFPNRKCILFDSGVDLRVLHPEEIEEDDVVDG